MKSLLTIFLMVTGVGSLAYAEPLDGKQVSADAKWLVHVDVDTIKTGKVPQTIGGLWRELPSASEGLKKLSRTIGMDPTKDLQSVTIYGRRYAQPSGVVILRAEVNRKRLMTLLRRKPAYRTDAYRKHELITWTENKGKKNEHTVTGCFHQPTVIVFGRDAAEVENALDVLDGKSRGLEESDPLFAPGAPDGTMIQGRATGLADVQQFKSPLVQESRFLFVGLGEREGEAFAVARVVTESADVADRVRAVAEGLLAMAELRFEHDQEMLNILEAVKVSTDEKTVTVEYRGLADDVAKLIEKVWIKQLHAKQAD